MTAILTIAAVALLGSFVCSLFEAVLYTTTPTYIEVLKARNVGAADKFAQLRENIDEPITAILTINTIMITVGAAWCGALVAAEFGHGAVGIFAVVFTLLVLFFTEILPKSIGVAYANSLAPLIAWPLQVMIWSVLPLVYLCGSLMKSVTASRKDVYPTEAEIMAMTDMAHSGGELTKMEMSFVRNALLLDKVKARDIMTPRTVVYTLPADLPLDRVQQHSEHWIHSRLPLVEDREPDKIVGMVHRRDVFDAIVRGKMKGTLRDLRREVDFVPDTMRGHQLLEHFVSGRKHMAIVVDEYGVLEGVITLEDVFEQLIGAEIVDEHDRHEDLQEFARQRAIASGLVSPEDEEGDPFAGNSSSDIRDRE